MNNSPKVSVIIPTYNRAHLIERSINSVLQQTYDDLELIVVDDASTDNTSSVISKITDKRLRYFRNEKNIGPSKSRNKGIELAKGELIAFHDSDDEWCEDKLEKQINLLNNSSFEVAAVYCGMEFFNFETGEKIGEDLREVNFREVFKNGLHFLTPANVTVMIKKEVLNEVGKFDERLHAMEDTELAIRVSKKYSYGFVKEPLVKVTRNHNQLTANAKNYTEAKEFIYEKHKDYLSNKILYALCKDVANYHILKGNYKKANEFVKNSFKHNINLKTVLQFTAINLFPALIRYSYRKKYSRGIPHPNIEGEFIKE